MPRKTEPTGLDPASERVVLVYAGDDSRHINGVPARDLSESDLCRLAYTRATDTDAVCAELIGSGLYAPAVEG